MGQRSSPAASQHAELDRERTWDDNTTVATHESLTLRILFDHEAGPRDATWTLAAYESLASERMWHMALTSTVPAPVLDALPSALAAGDAQGSALDSPIETTVTATVRVMPTYGGSPPPERR